MNPTIKILQSHRSIRKFTDQPIDARLLDDILSAGQSAATSSFIQATTVIRIGDSDKRNALVELTGGQKYVASCAEFFVLCADLHRNQQQVLELGERPDYHWTEQFLAATVDVGLFAQNMVIAAQSAGLGVCYIGGIRNHPEQVSEMLKLPDLVYPVFGLCLGYPDQNPDKKPRLPLTAVVHQDSYNLSDSVKADIVKYDDAVKAYYIDRTQGQLEVSWSQQMAKQAAGQSRPFMRNFLENKGFMRK
jgi:nitroreductase